MPSMIEMGSGQGRVEERIRQLEAVVARSRQRRRWRESRNNIESTYISSESNVVPTDRSEVSFSRGVQLLNRGKEIGKGCKRDSSHLIPSKALEIGSESKKIGQKERESFYDCSICLELATDPVLTSCGHLFCWACFYRVSKVSSNDKECPVCKGKVSDNTVIPIYGNNGDESVREAGLKIPPRPKGQRIESVVRQRSFSNSNGLSHSHVLEALTRIRITVSNRTGDETIQDGNSNTTDEDEGHNQQTVVRHGSRIQQVSRVLSESAASLTSLSRLL